MDSALPPLVSDESLSGLASGRLIIPGECKAEYEALEADLLKRHKPADITETLLVQEMAQSHWLKERAIRLQAKAFTESDSIPKDLAILMRYQTTNQRAYHKALNTLTKLQNQRKKDEIGFESQRQSLNKKIDKVNGLRLDEFLDRPTPGQAGWKPNATLEILTHNEKPVENNS